MSSHGHKKPKKKPQSAFFEMSTKDDEDKDQVISSSDEDNQEPEVRTEKPEVNDDDRLKDIAERDEFSERLKARDDLATKRKIDPQMQKMLEESAKRLKLEKEDRTKVVPDLRERSRQEYLKRREEDKLAELKDELEDEMRLFGDSDLTKYEIERREKKKTALELANQYREVQQMEKADRYYIPDEKNKHQRQDKYAEDIKEKGPNFEAKKWEEDQVNSALMKFGSKDAKQRLKQEKDYEYLLDDEIDFVKALQIPGKNEKQTKEEQVESSFERKKKSMQEVKESLPMFKYKERLLRAIKENQVIIIEGNSFF